jgi:hypothetical protein
VVGRKVGDHGVLQRRQDLCGALKNSNANESGITRRSLWAVAARVSSTKSHPFTSPFLAWTFAPLTGSDHSIG